MFGSYSIHLMLGMHTHPKVLLVVLVPRHQIVERDRHVGDEHVRDGALVEYRHAKDVGVFHLVDEALVPHRIECALLCRGSVCTGRKIEKYIVVILVFEKFLNCKTSSQRDTH